MDIDKLVNATEYEKIFYIEARNAYYKERNEFYNALFGDGK
ncbi:hypothetical protein AB8U03_15695 [Clostridium sp. Mt-5]|uniref:Uncharacterized protein n=1 Tax=Clostridium moutaii TaxID=3240932 RepID=A0ABV4BS56_9CLOT